MRSLDLQSRIENQPEAGCRILPWRCPELSYDPVLEAVLSRLRPRISHAVAEQREAPRLLAELLRLPHLRRDLLARNSERYCSYFLASLLLDASEGLGESDPGQAEDLAGCALVILDRLDPEWYGVSNLEDARSRAWRRIANARRTGADYNGAEAAFAVAEKHLKLGSCDPMEKAQLLAVKALLRRAQSRLVEAESLSRRAERLIAALDRTAR